MLMALPMVLPLFLFLFTSVPFFSCVKLYYDKIMLIRTLPGRTGTVHVYAFENWFAG